MKVEANRVVSFHYRLFDEDGELIDDTHGGEPLPYLHGKANIIAGLEQAMDGHEAGETLRVKVPPQLGYGLYDDDKVRTLEPSFFEPLGGAEIGKYCQLEDDQGKLELAQVVEVSDEGVTVDSNHPYAGRSLNFEIEIVEVREASSDELARGRIEPAGV
ncbi:peptidyl-prolyl cis-trans isomerase [Marinobacterium nitratireducens]|uniref:Peptidyl-prolyl cis-trans isomerase n=1 Tax=Marinobacterium nitratireducens TaxID=518897 RepID=A0A917ZP23_9GAMM|nr:peptidylprolyl isomerase [Marinobacterium nitratireducens]GGO86857.1 peptidyl-prolyl cis-trans isomerase [Marinobacterium nitratireducens]